MFEAAKPGDTVITLEVPRLCRSTKQLCEIIDTVQAKQLRLIIVGSITMDCRTGQPDLMTEAFLQIAGVFSQLELSMIRARVRSGMANAKAIGGIHPGLILSILQQISGGGYQCQRTGMIGGIVQINRLPLYRRIRQNLLDRSRRHMCLSGHSHEK